MASTSIFNSLFNGSGGRLALGSAVITYIVVYNEACAPNVAFATILATVYGAIAARCKSSLRSLQMPYVRASNKFDFGCLFLATWLDALAVLCACSILVRTLSACLDTMTGGLARILILGRNSPPNEIWPDVLGVAIVFLVTCMFMLGLEHTKAFSVIMSLGVFGLNMVLSTVGWWNGDFKEWMQNLFLPNGLNSLLTSAALLTFVYPSDHIGLQRFAGLLLNTFVAVSLLLTVCCLSTIVHYKPLTEYFAVPLFNILDENNFHKLIPAAACLLMLTCSGALLELFQELYNIVVRFATSEWKLLSKQISYESSESGNPILAIFIGGSLCAMLSFACPMQNLVYTLAASHLTAGFIRAFYLLYTPFRPKFLQPYNSDSIMSYSRLSTDAMMENNSTSNRRHRRSLWNLSLSKQKTRFKKPKVEHKNKQEVEKEWLLLGEPSSPCPQREARDIESAIISDAEPLPSDFEYPEKFDNSDTETSTDIDAIVDEYRQKIKVTTAGPMEHTMRVPSLTSWRVSICAMVMIGIGNALTVIGITIRWATVAITGCTGAVVVSLMMTFIPKHTSSSVINISPVISCTCIQLAIVLFSACALYSWPAIIFWLLAGLVMLVRCDNWCCNCFNHNTTINEQLIPSVSMKTTTICLPRPPKGIVTIPTRINGNR